MRPEDFLLHESKPCEKNVAQGLMPPGLVSQE
jgi:hypothetical protein